MYQELTGIQAKQIVILISVDHEQPQVFIKNRSDYFPILAQRLKEYKNANTI